MTDFDTAYDALVARWPAPVEQRDVPGRFGTTRVLVCGPADGQPLVLLHGGGATATVWVDNMGEWAKTHRVYALDLLGGAGRSVPGDTHIRTPGDLMTWLDETTSSLGLNGFDLCGHSYGGWIALRYALHAPGQLRRLVLLEPSRCFAGMRAGYLWHAMPILLRPDQDRVRRFLTWEIGDCEVDKQWLELAVLAVDRPTTKVVTGPRPRPTELRALQPPTLVLLAEHSRQHDIEAVAATARRLLPDVRTAVLPGLSHHSMPSGNPADLNRQVHDFLT